jgi:hypothetical protein
MKSYLRNLVFMLLLAFGVLAPEARPANAQSTHLAVPSSTISLTPGNYSGEFQFDARYIFVTSTKLGPTSHDIKNNELVDYSGVIKVKVTGPEEATIDVYETRQNSYEIFDFTLTGAGDQDCKMTGYIDLTTDPVFLSYLKNAYNSQSKSFKEEFSVGPWTKEVYKNIVDSSNPKCTEQVNEKILTDNINSFFNIINKHSTLFFDVDYSSNSRMGGKVVLYQYENSGPAPGGGWEMKTSGLWYAKKDEVKQKRWH